ITQRWFYRLGSDDSLQIQEFRGKIVVLDFWATWSGKSQITLAELDSLRRQYPDDVEVVAAAVKDATQEAAEWSRSSGYAFHFVDGTVHYQDLRLVGVPSRILFDREGDPQYVLG